MVEPSAVVADTRTAAIFKVWVYHFRHRLSSLRNFDRIVVLKAGRVCEDGPPQVLVRSQGVYCNLVRREVARLAKQAA